MSEAPRPAAAGERRAHIGGVTAGLTSDLPAFLDYADGHLATLAPGPDEAPRIRATLRWHEGLPPPRDAGAFAAWDRLDRDLYRQGDRLAWFRIDDLPDLHLRIALDGDQLRVEGDYYHNLGKSDARDRVRRLVYRNRLPVLRRRRFTTLLYYLVYYPCFWWLERHGGWHPIHAGAVRRPQGIVVMAGPSGVGKSTTVTGLATDADAALLSDTFVLHQGAQVRGVPEPLLLDDWSRQWMGAGAALLEPIDHRYSLRRGGYRFPPARLCAGGAAALLLFPRRAPARGTRRLAPAEAQGRVRAGDLIVNDLRRYWAFAAVLEMLAPTPLVQAREQSLAALVAAVPAYEIGLEPSVSLADMRELVDGLLVAGGA